MTETRVVKRDYTGCNPNVVGREKDVEITRLRSENEALKEALRPFFDGFSYDPGYSDLDNEQPITVRLQLGDWRRARRVLAALSKATGGSHEQGDDGFCWASNSDEEPSDPLVAYIEMPGSVPTSAGQEVEAASVDRAKSRAEAEIQFTARERAMITKLEMIATGRTRCGPSTDLEIARNLATEALAIIGWPTVRPVPTSLAGQVPDPEEYRSTFGGIVQGGCEECGNCSDDENGECACDRIVNELIAAVERINEEAAAPSAPGSVPTFAGQAPDGCVLVPKEPTTDMAEVARDWAQRDWKAFGDPKGYLKYYQGIYRAMLSAAPQPTAGGDANNG
jgi:hypothetical protein